MSASGKSTNGRGHALVIGASMGGLMAARALRDHFEQVTVIERDTLPDDAVFRAGVPQSRHIHILLARGYVVLERFFPGIMAALNDKGAPRLVWGEDTEYLTAGGWVKKFDTGIITNVMSRTMLETEVRHWLSNYTNVSFRQRMDVEDLAFSADGMKVIGVIATTRGSKDTETINADLVVDASGRNSKMPAWLKAHGFPEPEEIAVLSDLSYASRMYRKPSQVRADFPIILFLQGRPRKHLFRGGGIFEIEGGLWQVTLGGMNGDAPPTDEAGFMAFAKSLAEPDVYNAIQDAEPLGDVYGYRVDGSRWRHYERLSRRPENLIITGDSVCGFNPLYGQGMTVAAGEAEVLDDLLKETQTADLTGFAERFQKRIVPVIDDAWLLATGDDLRYPGTIGQKPNAVQRFGQRYIDLLTRSSNQDETVMRAFIQVANLSIPATALFAPGIVLRVLKNSLFPRRKAKVMDAAEKQTQTMQRRLF